VYLEDYLGEEVIVKERFVKKYRHPEMDRKLTRKRILQESRNIEKARKCLVNVPGLRKVDLANRIIKLEYLADYEAVKYFIDRKGTSSVDSKCLNLVGFFNWWIWADFIVEKCLKEIGWNIGKLHASDLLHGDLTTSNIMISKDGINVENSIYMIDFGLSYKSTVIEDKAVDLYVLEKAFICSHPNLEDKFQLILDGYVEKASKADQVIKRLNKGKDWLCASFDLTF
jgi:TP53 regulating kinase-like protein